MRKYVFMVMIGAGVLGIGTKMFRLYFLDWPNFMDAIWLITGATTLLVIGLKEVIKWTLNRQRKSSGKGRSQ